MKCHNCGKTIPDTAKACKYCEAEVIPKEEVDEHAALEVLESMPPEVREQLQQMMQESDTADEFVRQVFVGDCPKCHSQHTGDCMEDPELENPCIGRCYDCGYMWCTECGKALDPKNPECPCWNDPIPGLEDEV